MAGRARSTRAGHGPWRRTAEARPVFQECARPGIQGGVGEIDRCHRQHGGRAISGQPAAEVEPATGDHEIDDRQFWSAIGEELFGDRWVEGRTHLVSLDPQEVLEQFGRVRVAFREQDDDRDLARIEAAETARIAEPSRKQPVGVGCGGTALQLVDEEAQPVQLVAGVDALAALTPGRDHHSIALLPGPQCRGLDPEHARNRADRVDRPVAQPTVIVGLCHRTGLPGSDVTSESRPVSSRSRATYREGLMISSFARRARQAVSNSTNKPRPDASMKRRPEHSSSTSPSTPTRHDRTRCTSDASSSPNSRRCPPPSSATRNPTTLTGGAATVVPHEFDISSTIAAGNCKVLPSGHESCVVVSHSRGSLSS